MKNQPLRVLVLGDFRSFHLGRYLCELKRRGCEVYTASLERGNEVTFQLRRRGISAVFHYPLSSFEIKRIVSAVKPHVINPHFASGYGFSTALAKTADWPPVVLHLWGSDILVIPRKSVFHRRKTTFALRSADFVVGDSQYLLDEAGSLAVIHRKEVIPWGIEERYLKLHKTDYTLGNPLRIIVPRSHETIYNNRFLLLALAPLVRKGIISLTFPAFGSLYEMFRAQCEQLTDDGIRFYERLERNEFLALMVEHDCYLSAAKTDSSPVSLIEAMALGLLPIAADIPGVREWLANDNGWLFPQNSVDGLRSVIERIVSSDNCFKRLRKNNMVKVRQYGLFEKNIEHTLSLMRGLVEGMPR